MQVRVQQTIWQFFSQQQVATLEGWAWLEVWIHPSPPPPLGTVGMSLEEMRAAMLALVKAKDNLEEINKEVYGVLLSFTMLHV